MDIEIDTIPQELKEHPAWVNWIVGERNGKPTKIPITPRTEKWAKSNDPSTWASFDDAVQCYQECENNSIAGLGFMFRNSDLWGMDLDHCRDPETGIIEPWAMQIIHEANTYAEVSPSGTGVHLIGRGKLPPGGRKKGRVEMYDTGRFFTVTGHHIEGTPLTICDRQAEIEELHRSIFGKADIEQDGDEELIRKSKTASNGPRLFEITFQGNSRGV